MHRCIDWGWRTYETDYPAIAEWRRDTWRAGCGKSARPVRGGGTDRHGTSAPISPLLYWSSLLAFVTQMKTRRWIAVIHSRVFLRFSNVFQRKLRHSAFDKLR